MKKNFTELIFILDKSGSMSGLENDTIGGFNSMLEKECTVCGYTMATETIPATGGVEHTHSYGSEWLNSAF